MFRLARFLAALGRARSATGTFAAAEANPNEAYTTLSRDPGPTPKDRGDVLEDLVDLYEAWNATEPGCGYVEKAAEWRKKLDEWKISTQPATASPPVSEATISP